MPTIELHHHYVPTRRIASGRIASVCQLLVGTALIVAESLLAQASPARFAPDVHRRHVVHADSASAFVRSRVHRDIQTAVPLANHYFDRGLAELYAYRHAAAVLAFRESARLDPRCVMCALGEAIALGPTIDAAMDRAAAMQALSAIHRARALVDRGEGSVSDATWMRAVATRYSTDAIAARAERDTLYAAALTRLADANPLDADAQTLAAEATMILSPHRYWSDTGAPLPGTPHILALLRQAMRVAPGHRGACVFYAHVMESGAPSARCDDFVTTAR